MKNKEEVKGFEFFEDLYTEMGMPKELVDYKIQKIKYKAEQEYSNNLRDKFLSKIGYNDDIQAQEFVKSAALGDTEQCKLMIEQGININVNTSNGTALIAATQNEHIDLCKLLLEHGAHLNVYDISKKTPLMYAAKSGNVEICKLFMSYKPNIDISSEYIVGPTGYTLRQCVASAKKNQLEIHDLFTKYYDKFGVNLFECMTSPDPSPRDLVNYTHGSRYLDSEIDVQINGEDSGNNDGWCTIL